MRRPSVVLLLSAVALSVCVNGHPYSKVPDSYQLGEGFTSKKSSSGSSSNSFNNENQDNIEINGLHNGQAFAGSKASGYSSSGGSHSSSNAYSSASVSGAVPIDLFHGAASSNAFANSGAQNGAINSQVGYGALPNPGTGFLNLENVASATAINNAAAAGYDQSAENVNSGHFQAEGEHAGGQFWWMGQNSPFAQSGSSSISSGVHLNNQGQDSGIKSSGNPFLQQSSSSGSGSGLSFGSASSGASGNGFAFGSASSGASSSGQQAGAIDITKNPFLSGAGFAGSDSGAGSSASHGSASHGAGSTSIHTSGAQVPSISSGSSSSSVFGQQAPIGSGNPFFQQSSHGQDAGYGQQGTGEYSGYSGQGQTHYEHSSDSEGGLSVSCHGQGSICVAKRLCSADGYVNKEITQVRTGPQACDISSEVCCTLKSSSSDQSSAGTHGVHSTISTSFGTGITQAGQKHGGIFDSANGHRDQIDLNAGEGLFGDVNQAQDGNGYLPPLGSEPSSNVPAFSNPPGEGKPQYDDGRDSFPTNDRPNTIFPQAPAPPPQVGCAAALICVEEQFCTLEGSISPEPVALSSEQLIRRVPLSSCKNPDNGVIGKCCRDPNYVDPWPAGNLPANYSGGFDEQGFPTFLNIAKTRPPKKQLPVSPTKGGRPIKPSFPSTPQVNSPPRTPVFPPVQNVPNQIPNNFPNHVENSPAPFPQPSFPSTPQVNSPPRTPVFPPIQNVPNQIPNNFPNHVENSPAPFPQPPVAIPETPSTHASPGYPSIPQIPSQPSQPGFPSLPQVPQQPSYPGFPNLPNIQNQPTGQSGFPNFPNQQSQPGYPSHPSIPSQPTYNGVKTFPPKNHYDTSSSNENPIVLQTHIPGSQCGIRNKVQRPNGLTDVDVAFGEIPWQAMILLNTEKKLLCSGAIIAPNAVVTAARCVEGINPSEISVKTGEWKLGYELKHEEPLPFEIINVLSIAPYPEYHPGSPANDVAVLFLEHDIKLDQHVDMLCLPQGQPQLPQPGRKCISTGWGKTILQVHAAGALMHSIDVDVLSKEQCRQRLNGAESPIDIDDSLICTKAHRQNNNMCQVDLGGPLACDRGDGHYELVGVYNQDTGCLPTNQVATFATIRPPWIQETISQPPQVFIGQTPSQTRVVPQQQIVHNHGPEEPCDCQKSNLPSESNQYLPPQ